MAPSPKKHMATSSRFCFLMASAAPTAIGMPPADDAVGAEIAALDIGDVHRAAAAAAIAVFLAEELGEHQLRIGALGDAMAMAAMGRGDVVGLAQRHGGADRARLLADRQMHRAVDQAAHIGFLGAFLEAADEIHAGAAPPSVAAA